MWQSGSNEDLGRKETSTDKNKDSPIGGYNPTPISKPIEKPIEQPSTSKPISSAAAAGG